MESDEELATLSLDRLPFDCIVTLCEYLSAEDLAQFGLVCTVSCCVCNGYSQCIMPLEWRDTGSPRLTRLANCIN